MSNISFGTSGHRGIIGQTFTNHHIAAIALAVGDYFKTNTIDSPKVLIGFDTRTGNSPDLSEGSYTETLAKTLGGQKIALDFCDSYAPTPLISWAVKHHDYDLGIILTASHNPPNYNGIKLNDAYGAPASPELTDFIQEKANEHFEKTDLQPFSSTPSKPTFVNYNQAFISHLNTIIKTVFNLPTTTFNDTYIIDPKCGAAIDIWRTLTTECIGTIHWVNDHFETEFNFKLPKPTSNETLVNLGQLAKENQCVGIANDPDADRHAMVDESGQFVPPETIAAIIIDYCQKEGIAVESISTTLANSALVKCVAETHKIPINETKIGFKYFTNQLKAAFNKHALAIGVESSGGFSISHHTYDKCGFLLVLLILGIMKKKDITLTELQSQIHSSYKKLLFLEDAIEIHPDIAPIIRQRLSISKEKLSDVFDDEIMDVNTMDGLKITFKNNDWVLCRPSGTEPVIRIYSESVDQENAAHYIDQMQLLIKSIGE